MIEAKHAVYSFPLVHWDRGMQGKYVACFAWATGPRRILFVFGTRLTPIENFIVPDEPPYPWCFMIDSVLVRQIFGVVGVVWK